jgi:flagellar motor switch protein FliM
MASDRLLSQEEIDSVFRNLKGPRPEEEASRRAQPYDFRRPDRIAKDQLRAIHLLHDNFSRNLASSLSAYLRAYVMVNLVSVEQISFLEFSQCLPSPTCLVALGMRPFDGNAILELNPALVFPILEMLLGGSGRSSYRAEREVTEIEQSILDGVFRIILHDLRESWTPISQINYAIEKYETEPQLLQILAPNEAVVAIGMEVRIGDVSGMMNLAIPSIIIKMLRQKFDQQWSVRRSESTEVDQRQVWGLLQWGQVALDARLQHLSLKTADLLQIEPGDVLMFDCEAGKPMDLLVNGMTKWRGPVGGNGMKRVFQVEEEADQH